MLFAGDAILMTEAKEDLQILLNDADRFRKEMEVIFSKEKSQVLVVGNEEENQENKVWGESKLKKINEYMYLGLQVNGEGLNKERDNKIFKAEQWFRRLGSILCFRANVYEVTRGLWKGGAVSSIMYLAKTLNFREKEINNLNLTQRKGG